MGNMIDKTMIELNQRSKTYTVPHFPDDTVLAEQMQGTDEDATQTPSQDNENIFEKSQFQDEQYEVTDKDITETSDIATKFKLIKNFKYLWKKIVVTAAISDKMLW